jgi:hypothetical protein
VKRGLILFFALLLALSLCACGNRYRINVLGGADLVISCPKTAKAGETVTIETKCVTDGWLEVFASGAEVTAVQEDVFQFVMPRQDVDVRVLFAWDDMS